MRSVRTIVDRLNSRTVKTDDGCWIFQTTSKTHGGHCVIGWNGKTWLAHRASWVVFNGAIPNGLNVLHKCVGHPDCWNPEHLYLGTQKENGADAVSQGRFPDRRGENGGSAKLTNALVRELRGNREGFSLDQVAEMYGINRNTLKSVLYNQRIWTNV